MQWVDLFCLGNPFGFSVFLQWICSAKNKHSAGQCTSSCVHLQTACRDEFCHSGSGRCNNWNSAVAQKRKWMRNFLLKSPDASTIGRYQLSFEMSFPLFVTNPNLSSCHTPWRKRVPLLTVKTSQDDSLLSATIIPLCSSQQEKSHHNHKLTMILVQEKRQCCKDEKVAWRKKAGVFLFFSGWMPVIFQKATLLNSSHRNNEECHKYLNYSRIPFIIRPIGDHSSTFQLNTAYLRSKLMSLLTWKKFIFVIGTLIFLTCFHIWPSFREY